MSDTANACEITEEMIVAAEAIILYEVGGDLGGHFSARDLAAKVYRAMLAERVECPGSREEWNAQVEDGAALAHLEAELEAITHRICEIGNLANNAGMQLRAVAAERKIRWFKVAFVEFMAAQLNSRKDEVERNFAVFNNELPNLLQTHPGKFALMHNEEIIECMDTFGDALRLGRRLYPDGIFSVQEITTKRMHLGSQRQITEDS